MAVNPQVCFVGWCMDARGVLAVLGSIAALLVAALGMLIFDARRAVTRSQAAVRANRHATLASLVSVGMLVLALAGLVAGFVLGVPFLVGNGRLLAMAPAAAGLLLLGAQALGQVTWPKPTGAVREAELMSRSVADVAPRLPRTLVFVWAGITVALLVAFGLRADTPRSLVLSVDGATEQIGPYPGWHLGIPVSIAVVVLVIATELVLRLITLRPAVAGVSTEWDLHLRRRSAGHVAGTMQLVVATTTSGVLVAAGWAHLTLGRPAIMLDGGGWAYPGSAAQHWLGGGCSSQPAWWHSSRSRPPGFRRDGVGAPPLSRSTYPYQPSWARSDWGECSGGVVGHGAAARPVSRPHSHVRYHLPAWRARFP